MQNQWDPNYPIELLFKQIKDGKDFADAATQPDSAAQILNTAYILVFNIDLLFEAFKERNCKPAANKTWANFHKHLHEAQRKLQQQEMMACQAGYHSGMFAMPGQHEKLQEALANLATAIATGRQTMQSSTEVINSMRAELKKRDHQQFAMANDRK